MAVKDIITHVYTEWARTIGVDYSFEPSKTVASFPYASLYFMDTSGAGWDLTNEEVGVTMTCQVDIYIDRFEPLSKLYDIDAVSHATLEALGFRRISGLSYEAADYKRMTCRYRRVYGLADLSTGG